MNIYTSSPVFLPVFTETLVLGRAKNDGRLGKMLINVNERTPFFSSVSLVYLFASVSVTRLSGPARCKRWAVLSSHTSRCLARVDPNQRWHGGTVFSARGGWGGGGLTKQHQHCVNHRGTKIENKKIVCRQRSLFFLAGGWGGWCLDSPICISIFMRTLLILTRT